MIGVLGDKSLALSHMLTAAVVDRFAGQSKALHVWQVDSGLTGFHELTMTV